MRLFNSSKFSLLLFIFLATFIAGSGTQNAESNAAASGYVPCLPGSAGDLRTLSPSTLTVTVNVNDRRQTINNFGESDAWSTQFVGRWWPIVKRNAIADLLFETGLDGQNNPKGIGLSSWRFNVGAGSNRQSYIWEPWRRADTFLSAGSFCNAPFGNLAKKTAFYVEVLGDEVIR